MKTIFRYASLGLIMAVVLALGAVAVMAQDPCTDADGQTKMSDDVRAQFPVRTIEGRTKFIETGKQFLEKYGSCEAAKELADWLKNQLPKSEAALAKQKEEAVKNALIARFDGGMKAKNWDEVYASGKEILAKYGEEFRAVELVLGSIGYDELLDNKNSKYSDDTMKFAKQSLADLEAGKEFKPSFGVAPFKYDNKDHAIAWMNLTVGTIYQIGQKNKSAALPYLYKATQGPAGTDISKNPNPYEFIGSFYFDELNKLVDEIKTLADSQKDTDTPEVAQQKVDQIKAKVALSNGTSERAMDAFSRAYTLGQAPAYKARMKKNVEDAYNVRFGKKEGVDAWITSAVSKPFVSPMTPIQPISDPEPVKTDATTTAPATTAPAATAKPATPAPIKPTAPGTAKPSGNKPGAARP